MLEIGGAAAPSLRHPWLNLAIYSLCLALSSGLHAQICLGFPRKHQIGVDISFPAFSGGMGSRVPPFQMMCDVSKLYE